MKKQYYIPILILRNVKQIGRRIYLPFKLLFSGFINSSSYYPETPRKNKTKIFFELLHTIFSKAEINKNYFCYGLDRIGTDPNDFILEREALWNLYVKNTFLSTYDYKVLLRDKHVFSNYLHGIGHKTPLEFDSTSFLCRLKEKNTDFIKEIENKTFFLKPKMGECGGGIFKINIPQLINNQQTTPPYYQDDAIIHSNLIKSIIKQLETIIDKEYIVQEEIQQHEELKKLHPNSLNTIRLATIHSHNQYQVLAACLRIGIDDNIVDNWASGGIAIGIDIHTGKILEYGFYKPGHGTKATEHPNSKIVFKDFQIPYWQEAVNAALELHKHFNIENIGWDIAITPDGPIFVEGNDNHEFGFLQTMNGGLRKKIHEITK